MKKVVWKNKSNGQLCVTIPSNSDINEGDFIEIKKTSINKITYCNIVADLFHYGHLQLLRFAKSISDYNICGVLTDKAVEKYRVKPISNLKERKAVLSNLRCVDRVIVQKEKNPTENLKRIHGEFPNAEIILVHGSNWRSIPGSEYIKKINGKTVRHPYYEKLSNFQITNKIIENKAKLKDITDFSSLIKGEREFNSEYEKGHKVIVSTKADTLKTLQPLIKKSKIEKMLIFSISDWKNNKQKVLDDIEKKFSNEKIVIRSSAINEDTLDKSMAGCFESILNIDSNDRKEIEFAIKRVIGSYKNKDSESSFNQLLIQTQTKNIVMSGVIFTRTLETNAPYYVINYDDSTGESDTVTKGIENKIIKISKFIESKDIPRNLKNLIISVKEIENLIPRMGLDIEFAINKEGEVIIFQVRPLITGLKEIDDNKIKGRIDLLKKRFKEFSDKRDHLAGNKNIFADMPDWNPAEIIGDKPNHLDYSLYDYIITNSAWHEARTSQGYYNVNPAKLVVLFGNKPYVDVRNSFNSFIPNTISQNLREKLVFFYLDKLEKNPDMQDKVEFEVVHTCYDLCFDQKSKELLEAGFANEEIAEFKNALINLTNNLIINSKESIQEDLYNLKEMEKNREGIKPSDDIIELLKNAKLLLDDCRNNGTVQFSRLARLGFVGKIILKSLVRKGIIDSDFYDRFMNSISTVATEINKDFKLMGSGNISREEFIRKYYHLRPGSYDITSLRYESNPDLLKTINVNTIEEDNDTFEIDKKTEEDITKALEQEGLKFDSKELFEFIRRALEAREFSKFEFSKNLSDAIELIALSGDKMGFTRHELSMLDIREVFSKLIEDKGELAKIWKNMISSKMIGRELNNKISMPPIIFSEKDFDVVEYYLPRPNYITQKKVEGDLLKLNNLKEMPEIKGKIIMIENGDPGYDWIFTRNPAGLITKYGGIASHMSIRCAEFGIPAAIGCGSVYDQLIDASGIILDCRFGKITPIKG